MKLQKQGSDGWDIEGTGLLCFLSHCSSLPEPLTVHALHVKVKIRLQYVSASSADIISDGFLHSLWTISQSNKYFQDKY